MAMPKVELSRFPNVFPAEGRATVPTAGLEEIFNVHWYDHSYYSRHRPARRIQRHRWRTVLRHGLLRRRRPRPDHRDPAGPAIARQAVSLAKRRVGKGALAPCPPTTHAVVIPRESGVSSITE